MTRTSVPGPGDPVDAPTVPPTRRRATTLLAVGVTLVLVLCGVVLLLRDALALERSATAAERAFAAARAAASDADLVTATDELDRAAVAVAAAQGRADGPGWWLAARTPMVGPSVRAVRDSLAVVDAATDVAAGALAGGEALLGGDALPALLGAEGRVDLDEVARLHALVDGLPVSTLEAAVARLADHDPAALVEQVADGRADVLRAAREVLDPVHDARTLLGMLPALLGADGPRDYLVVLQNAGEMRGTGGFPGFLLVMSADDGQITVGEGVGYDPFEAEAAGWDVTFGRTTGVFGGDRALGPGATVPVSEEFAARYGHTGADFFFGNANLDPDLRIAAPLMLDLYERATGRRLDGVVLADPVLLQMVMRHIGPLELPPGTPLPDARIPVPVPANRLAEVALVDAYDVFGGVNRERTLFQTGLAFGAFQTIFGGQLPDPVGVARSFGQAATQRHLQAWSRDDDVQAALEALDVAGTIAARDGEDLLAVTQNNASADKSDTFLRLEHDIVVRLGPPLAGGVAATRHADVRVAVTNTLDPDGRDLYFVTTSDEQRLGEPRRRRPDQPGLNRTWLTLWGPEATALQYARDGDGALLAADGEPFNGLRPVDQYVETWPGATSVVALGVQAPVTHERVDEGLRYRLRVRRTPKLRPDQLAVTISPPDGWVVSSASGRGGGGFAVGGAVADLVARTTPGEVRVEGPYVSDVVIEVVLAPSG